MLDESARVETAVTEALVSRETSPRSASDYEVVRRTIEFILENWRDQPQMPEIAGHLGMDPVRLQRLFARWCGLTPKCFLQAITLDNAKRLLDQQATVLETAYEAGLSGPGRLHDLFVVHEAMTPGEYRARGGGLTITYGFHESLFGEALVMTTPRGLAGLAFADGADGRAAMLEDMTRRWPAAEYVRDEAATEATARRIFDTGAWSPDTPLRVVLIGSDFEVRVWETLLGIPFGRATTYGDVASRIGRPTAARAVGAAIGRNPISFVVPCHRVVAGTGRLTGYHWGLTRKRAMLGWERAICEGSDLAS
ncbi:methylated-DNA--[protein]-cysteine S-methyltransferase [Lutibaculum baratangense]|uniref:methylated-DNA--[protein]-cysteine S-methyltransferase n=1 Tax=Lutibaculum baratangense AMV1 TaxID=631454 RepID=V4TJK6_9HYPH|nr:bifunctional helix-turn-helix domain-containing protein/methylated-DNA--[protein]-cysteine S-methyltransferase [Lutibaculum baratangense]ESR26088.1 ADA regulatory protein [Lutibaculum baratangense AMV1]